MTTRSEHNRNARLRVANAAFDKEECLKLGLSQNDNGVVAMMMMMVAMMMIVVVVLMMMMGDGDDDDDDDDERDEGFARSAGHMHIYTHSRRQASR